MRRRKYASAAAAAEAARQRSRAYYLAHKTTVYTWAARKARDDASKAAGGQHVAKDTRTRLAVVAPRMAIIRTLPVHVPGSLVFPLLYGSGRR